ncbi:HigA family addiction module antitoxin [Leadbettera azotonutricia]|uniref:Plasmid maintenance system antidote protein n=1 Tax=Leadbettera azotonutricia (strain ATCC BAA-888 / DSM 13862 / ZAS-9) TaxID=545695 RepID=F5Y9Y6_LEAAZ|nr:HigA family addiction module antitoxin [Leadbettera azotonutricia]AEF81636.1 plasmid maintenance system antidote protein [Leadbettera azotonutricia ZAS-9]
MPKITAKDPGTVLKAFLEEYQLNPSKVGVAVKLSQSTIRQITLNKIKISIPIALRFAKLFGNGADFWIDLQAKYELAENAKDSKLQSILKSIEKAKKPAPGAKAAPKSAKKAAAPKKAGRPAGAKKAVGRGRKPSTKKAK